jgi:hypothetical protein
MQTVFVFIEDTVKMEQGITPIHNVYVTPCIFITQGRETTLIILIDGYKVLYSLT